MNPEIAQRLIRLNQEFYEQFAESFAASRPKPLPGIERLLDYVPDESTLLDVGCGSGQLAIALDRLGRRVHYIGVDASAPLVKHALQATANLRHVTSQFLIRDVTAPGWADDLPHRPFHVVTALALLHHIPGQERRIHLLREMAQCLRPEGTMLLSTWQFLYNPRLRRRLQPWSLIGLHPDDVEPGDYLLDWRRDGYGLRYCALINEATLHQLAKAAGLQVIETFYAGRDDLNLCAVLRHAPTKRPHPSNTTTAVR